MNDPLLNALRSERDALAGQAPLADFPGLWREVGERRERRLQRLLVLAAAVPTLLLFLGGVASLLLGGGAIAALPLLAVALWLVASGGIEFAPVRSRAGKMRQTG